MATRTPASIYTSASQGACVHCLAAKQREPGQPQRVEDGDVLNLPGKDPCTLVKASGTRPGGPFTTICELAVDGVLSVGEGIGRSREPPSRSLRSLTCLSFERPSPDDYSRQPLERHSVSSRGIVQ